MEKSFGLLFFLRKPKNCKGDNSHIYMRITVDGCSNEISIKRKCDPEKWNHDAGRMSGKTDAAKELNAYLDIVQLKVFEAKRKLIEIDQILNSVNIKKLLLGEDIDQEKHMLMEIFKHHNNQMAALVNREYAPGTVQRYNISYNHTQSFLQWKYKISDIEINKLDFEFISEYEFWLKSIRKCDHNTTMKYLSNFRKIVNRCLRNGWLQRDPFMGFKMTKKIVERTALTEFELQILISKKFSFERLTIVRDIFLFSCFSGLAYVDVKKLSIPFWISARSLGERLESLYNLERFCLSLSLSAPNKLFNNSAE